MVFDLKKGKREFRKRLQLAANVSQLPAISLNDCHKEIQIRTCTGEFNIVLYQVYNFDLRGNLFFFFFSLVEITLFRMLQGPMRIQGP